MDEQIHAHNDETTFTHHGEYVTHKTDYEWLVAVWIVSS